jgi:hypothetical protein
MPNPSALTHANVICSRGRAAKNANWPIELQMRAQLLFSASLSLGFGAWDLGFMLALANLRG